MAADFGALEEFIDDYDVAFEFRGKEYKESFDFANVAAFKAWLSRYSKRLEAAEVTEDEQLAMSWYGVAILTGGKFDSKAWKFTGLPKGHFLTQIVADGASYDVVDRLVNSIFAKYRFGDDIATAFYRERDLGKALKVAADNLNLVENQDQETPQEAGETNEDDSETSKD